MKGVYFTTICDICDEADTAYPGIRLKIRKQVEILRNHGIDMVFWYAGGGPEKGRFHKYISRLPFYRDRYELKRDAVRDADFIYVRKPLMINMGLVDLLKRIRKENPGIKILLEVPTYPYDSEVSGLFQMPFLLKDRHARKNLKKVVDVVLTYSDDKEIFGINTINISNGIDTKAAAEALSGKTRPEDGKLRIMACARFDFWHGYDRALEGLHRYLQDPEADKNIELEMVGEGPALASYKELAGKYGLQEYVRFYGKLQGRELSNVYAVSDIGLDSMGRHRSGVYYNSSLKGKEYCAYGLVIVSGVRTELDSDESFPYYFRIPADETPLNFHKMIEFYRTAAGNGKDRNDVRREIMEYAASHFSMEVVFRPVIEYICS